MTMGDVYGRNRDALTCGRGITLLEHTISLRQKISVCSLLHVSLFYCR